MTTTRPSDHAERSAALDPARSFLVQAPAGSGKTELLTDRILALLAGAQRPEEIVAITFTRKAASEMHARVLGKLEAGRGPCPQAAQARHSWTLAQQVLKRDAQQGWELLHYPSRLGIRTIDAFCSTLVRAMPWLSAMGGGAAIAEPADALYEDAARATLARVGEDASVARLLEHLDVNIGRATNLLTGMLAARDQWLPLLVAGTDAAQLDLNLVEARQQDLQALSRLMPPAWAAQLAPVLRHAAARAANGDPQFEALFAQWDGQPFAPTVDDLPRWQALADFLLTQKNTPRRKIDRNMGLADDPALRKALLAWLQDIDPDAPWVRALGRTKRMPAQGYTQEQQAIIRAFLEVLLQLAGQLQLSFADAGEIDFVEILQRALRALGSPDAPSDLMLRLDQQIRHILVDEFQDTSQAQVELLEGLTAGWTPGDGRSLFLVGDPMQSIYRFRKAEVGLFLWVRSRGLGPLALEALTLTNNFRSHAGLVSDVNRLFAPVFPQYDDIGQGAIRYSPSEAYHPASGEHGVQLHPVWVRKQGRVTSAHESGERLSQRVVELAAQALRRHEGRARPVAILVRARSHLGSVIQALQQAGLPCRAVEIDRLHRRPLLIDLVQLARALSHAADRLAWLSVLRSPLCGLTLDALHGLFGLEPQRSVPGRLAQWVADGCPVSSHLPAHEAARLAQVAAVMLAPAPAGLPFAAWVEQCWEALGGPGLYGASGDAADVQQVLALVDRLAPWGGLNPAELEAGLARLYASSQDGGPAIEVMTIHKAKGLEFDTVILLGLEYQELPDRSPLIRFEHAERRLLLGPVQHGATEKEDPITRYLAEREKIRSDHERTRLLYVAMTRASDTLHIVARVRVDENNEAVAPVPSSLLAVLWARLTLPEPPSWASLPESPAPENGEAQQARPMRRLRHLPAPRPALPPAPAGVSAGAVWGQDGEGRLERLLGTVAHAWLERIGRDGLSKWPVSALDGLLPVLARQLSRAGVPASALDGAVAVLHDTLKASLSSERGRWLLGLGANAYREWSLLDLGARVSVIDLAVSLESGWLIVDYKTGVPAPGEAKPQFIGRMKALHGPQLQRYCAHVNALDGRPAQAALYFPRADLWVEL